MSITKLLVNVVSGLQLNIVPDSSGENIYIAETSITRKLSAQYQVNFSSFSFLREERDNSAQKVD